MQAYPGGQNKLFRALRIIRRFFTIAPFMQSLGPANSTLGDKAKSLFLCLTPTTPRWFPGVERLESRVALSGGLERE
jgi:hypothetical protein